MSHFLPVVLLAVQAAFFSCGGKGPLHFSDDLVDAPSAPSHTREPMAPELVASAEELGREMIARGIKPMLSVSDLYGLSWVGKNMFQGMSAATVGYCERPKVPDGVRPSWSLIRILNRDEWPYAPPSDEDLRLLVWHEAAHCLMPWPGHVGETGGEGDDAPRNRPGTISMPDGSVISPLMATSIPQRVGGAVKGPWKDLGEDGLRAVLDDVARRWRDQ